MNSRDGHILDTSAGSWIKFSLPSHRFRGAPGGIRTPNPQIRSYIEFLLTFCSPVILRVFRHAVNFLFIPLRLVFVQSGSKLVASSLPYPQIWNLLPRKKLCGNGRLQVAATALLPQVKNENDDERNQ